MPRTPNTNHTNGYLIKKVHNYVHTQTRTTTKTKLTNRALANFAQLQPPIHAQASSFSQPFTRRLDLAPAGTLPDYTSLTMAFKGSSAAAPAGDQAWNTLAHAPASP